MYKDWRQGGGVWSIQEINGQGISMTETKDREDCFIVGLFAHWDLVSRGRVWEAGKNKEQR